MNGICNVYKEERERMREQKKKYDSTSYIYDQRERGLRAVYFFFFFLWETRRGQDRSQQRIDAIIMES